MSEEKEYQKPENKKGLYMPNTYRGARFLEDTDLDCMVKSLVVSFRGREIYSGPWIDVTENFDYSEAERAVDRFLDNKAKANEKKPL